MPILRCKSGEGIILASGNVIVTIRAAATQRVHIGTSAPADVRIHHEEFWKRDREDHPEMNSRAAN